MQSLAQRLVAAMREHLAGGPPLPPEGSAPLWNAFNALSAARTWHASGPNPISYPEIEAYARLMRWPFEPHHVAALRAMDAEWIAHVQRRTTGKPQPGGQLSPAVFDAVFGDAAG